MTASVSVQTMPWMLGRSWFSTCTRASGDGTTIDYRAALDVKAPLPGFILRRVTDGLVAASLPNMFASIEREVRARQARTRQT